MFVSLVIIILDGLLEVEKFSRREENCYEINFSRISRCNKSNALGSKSVRSLSLVPSSVSSSRGSSLACYLRLFHK